MDQIVVIRNGSDGRGRLVHVPGAAGALAVDIAMDALCVAEGVRDSDVMPPLTRRERVVAGPPMPPGGMTAAGRRGKQETDLRSPDRPLEPKAVVLISSPRSWSGPFPRRGSGCPSGGLVAFTHASSVMGTYSSKLRALHEHSPPPQPQPQQPISHPRIAAEFPAANPPYAGGRGPSCDVPSKCQIAAGSPGVPESFPPTTACAATGCADSRNASRRLK